jgi:hypothetical protein
MTGAAANIRIEGRSVRTGQLAASLLASFIALVQITVLLGWQSGTPRTFRMSCSEPEKHHFSPVGNCSTKPET